MSRVEARSGSDQKLGEIPVGCDWRAAVNFEEFKRHTLRENFKTKAEPETEEEMGRKLNGLGLQLIEGITGFLEGEWEAVQLLGRHDVKNNFFSLISEHPDLTDGTEFALILINRSKTGVDVYAPVASDYIKGGLASQTEKKSHPWGQDGDGPYEIRLHLPLKPCEELFAGTDFYLAEGFVVTPGNVFRKEKKGLLRKERADYERYSYQQGVIIVKGLLISADATRGRYQEEIKKCDSQKEILKREMEKIPSANKPPVKL